MESVDPGELALSQGVPSLTASILEYLDDRRRIQPTRQDGRPFVSAGFAALYAKLTEALADDLARAGLDRSAMVIDARVAFPGTYGLAPRQWDLVVLDDDLPTLVVEVKADLGPNPHNLRNRLNDILSLVTNLSRMFDGEERAAYKPCVAILFVMLEAPALTKKRWLPANLYYPGDESPKEGSFIDLLGVTLSRMLDDKLIDAACLLTVDEDKKQLSEPRSELSFGEFSARIIEHLTTSAEAREGSGLGAASFGRAFSRGSHVDDVVSGITSTPEGLSAVEAAVIRERRRIIAGLLQLARDPATTETKMHGAIGSHYWIFGGQYIGVADRRTLVPLDQYDIPLICADGSLEIVELKGPGASLVRKHRNHLIVANEVHEAVNQCLNYLRSLDEAGATLTTLYRNESGTAYDLRRAKGTIVLGHPDRATSVEATREQIDQTIRSYNAHLSRLRVLTYADLLESAERALQFASEDIDHSASGELS
jgi:hypothetical protein